MRRPVLGLIAVALLAGGCAASPKPPPRPDPPAVAWTVFDRFGRDVTARGVTLVDWDGHLANPAVAIRIAPPDGLQFPVTLSVTTDEPRIYFDHGARDESKCGPYTPPAFTHTFSSAEPLVVRIAIWPDEDGADERHVLHLAGGGVSTDVRVLVVDQDLGTPITYPILVDFSQDPLLPDGTRFFDDPAKRAVVEKVARDWAYFFDGAGLDRVAAGEEATEVDGAEGWYGRRRVVRNASPYTGFLLYALGVHTHEIRSTGRPSRAPTYETKGGLVLPGELHRSGAMEIEREGNFDTAGWYVSTSEDTWFLHDNMSRAPCTTPTDLASIVHHEMAHALFFCGAPKCGGLGYSRFTSGSPGGQREGPSWGVLTSPEIRAYYAADERNLLPDAGPGALPVDFRNHFSKETSKGPIDPASGFGAFGTEYADNGSMPRRRWIITKLDLLAAQAVGYPLRASMSPFVPLSLTSPASAEAIAVLPPGRVGTAYAGRLVASGGVPPYDFRVVEGSLPDGVTLDSFEGALRGTPTRAGVHELSVRVEDSLGATTASQRVRVVIDG